MEKGLQICAQLFHNTLIFICKTKGKTFILERVDLLAFNVLPKYATYTHRNGLAATGLQLFLAKKDSSSALK